MQKFPLNLSFKKATYSDSIRNPNTNKRKLGGINYIPYNQNDRKEARDDYQKNNRKGKRDEDVDI